jgi:hypothetical protein
MNQADRISGQPVLLWFFHVVRGPVYGVPGAFERHLH